MIANTLSLILAAYGVLLFFYTKENVTGFGAMAYVPLSIGAMMGGLFLLFALMRIQKEK
ncbi:hypothetical protein [Halobacillus sp. A5]|uniref:hypothetical protein n=1 Tax=Halobacillus sp. A5 TaxID=2880263 RepID=UPI0020A66A28|nr:hypothetical protein [Halobacillus sp. A5]MCP3027831.1 hypothetical protein [Halobacillus sp. A5]